MDPNKLKVLRELDYKINKCCGNCQHSRFKAGSFFGECLVKDNEYVHEKHTGEKRKLSINYFGECGKHNFQKRYEESLEKFEEFVRE